MKGQSKDAPGFRVAVCLLVLMASLGLPASKPSSAQPIAFGDPAFASQWDYSDRAVREQRVTRTWLWGPAPLGPARPERMVGSPARDTAPADYHLVQYFDKARMEFNAKEGIVTNGRLVVELMMGDIQIGLASDKYFTIRPSSLPIAGDTQVGAIHTNTPTYASLFKIATIGGIGAQPTALPANTPIMASYARSGITAILSSAPVASTLMPTVGTFEHGHNIPNFFWDFLNRIDLFEGKDWVKVVGLPITEPYWAQVRVDRKDTWVMFQAFERRILTYNPLNPVSWRVEMGNVGQHYMAWRPEPLQKPNRVGALVVDASKNNTAKVCPSYTGDNYLRDVCIGLVDPQPSDTTLRPQSWARTYLKGWMLLQSDNAIYDMQSSTKLVFKRIDNSVDSVNQQGGRVDYLHGPKKRIGVETSLGLVTTIGTRFSVIVTDTAKSGEAQLRIVVPSKGGSVTLLPHSGNLIIVRSGRVLTAFKGQPLPDTTQAISAEEKQYWDEKVYRLQHIPGLQEITRLGEVLDRRLVLAYYQPSFTLNDWQSGNTSDSPTAPYESSSSSTLTRHIAQAWNFRIDGLVGEWSGVGTLGDQNLGKLLGIAADMSSRGYVEDGSNTRIYPDVKAGMYFMMNLLPGAPGEAASQVGKAISTYAGHSNYLRWGGKPVFFFRNIQTYGDLQSWRDLRAAIDPQRVQLWVADSADNAWLDVFDALNLLDGGLQESAGQLLTVNHEVRAAIDRYNIDNAAQRLWTAGVVPGWDNSKLKVGGQFNLNPKVIDRKDGSTYEASWCAAIESGADWVLINSFNDWYQGTQIEPSLRDGNIYFTLTAKWSGQYEAGTSICGP